MPVLCGARTIPTSSVERARRRWKRIFTPAELAAAGVRARSEERLAARLAAKKLAIDLFESLGFSGATCLAVEIRNNAEGQPYLRFPDRNLSRFAEANLSSLFLTLSHTRGAGYAAVYARTAA